MVGSAIESILSSVTSNVTGGRIPDSGGSKWVIYTMISDVPHNTKDAASDFNKYRFQLDIYARTYSDADTLAASVKSAMDEYSGTAESVVIDHIYFDGEYIGRDLSLISDVSRHTHIIEAKSPLFKERVIETIKVNEPDQIVMLRLVKEDKKIYIKELSPELYWQQQKYSD